jgi:hypothetical protein
VSVTAKDLIGEYGLADTPAAQEAATDHHDNTASPGSADAATPSEFPEAPVSAAAMESITAEPVQPILRGQGQPKGSKDAPQLSAPVDEAA